MPVYGFKRTALLILRLIWVTGVLPASVAITAQSNTFSVSSSLSLGRLINADSTPAPKSSTRLAVTIRVVDLETGAVVPDAELWVLDAKNGHVVTPQKDSLNQAFTLFVLPGTVLSIQASTADYLLTKARSTILSSPRQLIIKLVKPKPSVLTIKVFAGTINQPLPSAVAQIYSQITGKSERFGLPGGRLERIYTQPDSLRIEISAAGYTSVSRQLNIEVPPSGKRYELDAELDKITVETRAQVIDSQAGPTEKSASTVNQIKTPAIKTSAAPVSAMSSVAVSTKAFGVIEKGKNIRLDNVYFDQSSPALRAESHTELDQLYTLLLRYPSLQIEIRGYTDNQGDFDLNTQLSRDRCQAVINYLTGKGIPKTRLKAVGRGPLDPVAPNTTEENRKKNRRVEFVVR